MAKTVHSLTSVWDNISERIQSPDSLAIDSTFDYEKISDLDVDDIIADSEKRKLATLYRSGIVPSFFRDIPGNTSLPNDGEKAEVHSAGSKEYRTIAAELKRGGVASQEKWDQYSSKVKGKVPEKVMEWEDRTAERLYLSLQHHLYGRERAKAGRGSRSR